jgi:ribulose-phosphate 3-epimerase
MTRRVAPSVLAADFGRIRAQVEEVVAAGAEVIHVDIMDGHFVPTLSMGPQAVSALRDLGVLLDVHLMVERPERHVAAFAAAGADSITVHYEATPHVHYALQAVRDAGCATGLALNPGTPAEVVRDLTEEADMVLCMTVNPGWGGQDFLERSLDRLERIRALIGPDRALEVDGGIDEHTAPRCAQAGATVFVAGTAVFGAADPQAAVRAIVDATAR